MTRNFIFKVSKKPSIMGKGNAIRASARGKNL